MQNCRKSIDSDSKHTYKWPYYTYEMHVFGLTSSKEHFHKSKRMSPNDRRIAASTKYFTNDIIFFLSHRNDEQFWCRCDVSQNTQRNRYATKTISIVLPITRKKNALSIIEQAFNAPQLFIYIYIVAIKYRTMYFYNKDIGNGACEWNHYVH